MASSGEKSLAVGHIPGFQIDPNRDMKKKGCGGESENQELNNQQNE